MRTRKRGQSLVEFALIAVMLALTLALAVDFARVFSAYIMVGNMARAGAQYGTVANQMGDSSANEARNGMIAAAYEEQDSIFGTTPNVRASMYEDSDGLCVVNVDVEYEFSPLLAIPPIPGTITISRSSEMRGQVLDLCQ
jgi:Flp pilus assembly protein TadG